MSLIPEDASPGVTFLQLCVQELRQPYLDYTKIQALATLSLAEALPELAEQMAEIGHQITLAATGGAG